MIGNYKLANRLSEAYANGEIGPVLKTDTYQISDYNNYNDPYARMNNLGSSEMLDRYSGNPVSVQQRQRFGEIANQILDENDELTAARNANLLNFQNSLTNSFSSNSPQMINRGSLSHQLSHSSHNNQTLQNLNKTINNVATDVQELTQYVPVQKINDLRNEIKDYVDNKEGYQLSNNYRQERDYRNGYIDYERNCKQITLIIIIILVSSFMFYMLVQLYMAQKRLEYLFVYTIPKDNIYYQMQQNAQQYNAQQYNA